MRMMHAVLGACATLILSAGALATVTPAAAQTKLTIALQ